MTALFSMTCDGCGMRFVGPDCTSPSHGKTSSKTKISSVPSPRDWRLRTSKQISDAAIAAEEGRGAPEKVMTTDAERAADECDRLRFETAKRDVDDLRASVAKYRAALESLGARHESALTELHNVNRLRADLLMENALLRRQVEAMERKERKR